MFRYKFIFKEVNNILIRLPAPVNISYFWNFRSCLRILLALQVISRIFLSILYTSESNYTFKNVNNIIIDNNFRWTIRLIHTVGASFLILLLYLHFLRRFFYKRYVNKRAWIIRVILIIIMIRTAFLGYVLPWRQISFWRATVITNLITTIPYIREPIVNWLWRRFSVSGYTLTRFFSFHFILPFGIILFSLLHLLVIHTIRARNLLRTSSNLKIDFWPFFRYKDLLGFFLLFFCYFFFIFFYPYNLIDPENFLIANPSITPLHIKPEWYFLFAYAILRCIPNKTARVIVLVLSILVFFLFPFANNKKKIKFNYIYKFFFFIWLFNFFLLTWLGRCPVKVYFNFLSQISRIIYFFLLFVLMFL